jgi:hypothetical protein
MDTPLSETTEQTASEPAHEMAELSPHKIVEKTLAEMEEKPKAKIEIDAERIRTSIARLTSNSIGELEGLASELQKLDEFIKYETERIQRDIDSLLSGIKIIVETISPWKRSATVSSAPLGPARTVFAGGRNREETRRTPARA